MPSYQTRNPKAVNQPLRSVPLFRPASVLGSDFVRQQNPLAFERQVAARELQLARFTLEQAERAYAASRAELGDLNRRRAKNRHDRDITPDRIIARMVRDCFGTMNRRRGALLQAKRALHTAQTTVARLAD